MPIQLKLRDDLDEAIAAYKHYDVLLVNAMFDGMNLVAKEGPIVNEHEGVSILSENTGAHEELGEYALSVNPFDIQELADSIHAALTMDRAERRAARAGPRGDRHLARPGRLDRRAARRHPGEGSARLGVARRSERCSRGRRTRYSCPLHMTLPAPTYDLMLLLDPQAEEAARAKIVADARAAIEARASSLARTTGASARSPTRSIARRTPTTTCCSSTPASELLDEPRPHAADHRRRDPPPHHQAAPGPRRRRRCAQRRPRRPRPRPRRASGRAPPEAAPAEPTGRRSRLRRRGSAAEAPRRSRGAPSARRDAEAPAGAAADGARHATRRLRPPHP